jgi:hypothetical protein
MPPAHVAVVTRQRGLAAFVEPARFGQGEGGPESQGRRAERAEAEPASFALALGPHPQRTERCPPGFVLGSAAAAPKRHRPPRSAWACSATIRRSAPSGPPIAAERRGAPPVPEQCAAAAGIAEERERPFAVGEARRPAERRAEPLRDFTNRMRSGL